MKIQCPSEAFQIRLSYGWTIAMFVAFAVIFAAGIVDISRDAWEEHQAAVNWVPPTDPYFTMFYAVNGIVPTAPTPDYTLHAAGVSLLVLFIGLCIRAVVDMHQEMHEKLSALV